MNLSKWKNLFRKLYLKTINSIAFYPTLLTVSFIIFATIIMRIEFNEVVIELKKEVPHYLVHDSNNARLILGTIVGSLISLMVFSFSMVMVVLNRATSTLSPRVLPGLISNKFHQIVLGFYIGSIIFSLLLIVNIDSPEVDFSVPSLGILISMLMTIICLGLFVYFIHSISQKIQVDNILADIYRRTKTVIEKHDSRDQKKVKIPDSSEWISYGSVESGYLKKINTAVLKEICELHETTIRITVPIGAYVVEESILLRSDKSLEEDVIKQLLNAFIFYPEERIADHYLFGFKQISEVAVKALSPGINDPGTALKGIDLLTDLFVRLMAITPQYCVLDRSAKPKVYLKLVATEQMIFQIMGPVRSYGKDDAQVLRRLIEGLELMRSRTKSEGKYIDKFINKTKELLDDHLQEVRGKKLFV